MNAAEEILTQTPSKVKSRPIKLTPRQVENFWRKVEKSDGCWMWTGTTLKPGYGVFGCVGGPRLAHRVSMFLKRNEDIGNLCVLHRCDNPKCVNPEHLFLGTEKENSDDMMSKGRHDPVSGERCGKAKLKSSQVIEIRRLMDAGTPRLEVAAMFSVTPQNIGAIWKRQLWKHIP